MSGAVRQSGRAAEQSGRAAEPRVGTAARATHPPHRHTATPPHTFHVALTGNIAAGKSAVTGLLKDWGATVIDADSIVRELQQPGTPVFEAIVDRFGPGVLTAQGTLDRAALRTRILASQKERTDLEGIVHPAVLAERTRLLEGCRKGSCGIVVSDIPLLFEVMDPAGFDAVVLVDAPESLRLERLTRERGLTIEEARSLLGLQLPTGPKRSQSDFVIDNDHSKETLRDRTWLVWRKLMSLAHARA